MTSPIVYKKSDNDDIKGIWTNDEFEGTVSRALVAMYENKINKNKKIIKVDNKSKLYLNKWRNVHHNSFKRLKEYGPYFPPTDRYIMNDEYWYDIDGIPDFATFSMVANRTGLDDIKSYLEIFTVEKVNTTPRGVVFPMGGRPVAKYRLNAWYAKNEGGFEAYTIYSLLRKNGVIHTEIGQENAVGYIAATLGFYADKKYIWNVRASEDIAKANFGVHKEQIKSLFYARSLPLTTTGRKRPILHWVRSHKRRLENGIDIDIDKYLRGINKFEFNGTVFEITNPTKVEK